MSFPLLTEFHVEQGQTKQLLLIKSNHISTCKCGFSLNRPILHVCSQQ